MILFGIGYYLLIALLTKNFYFLQKSLEFGFLSYFFGFFLFVLGQWGEGDARLLAGISFLLPFYPFSSKILLPFPLTFIFNLFLIGTIYMIFYAFIFSYLKAKKVFSIFKKEVKKRYKILSLISFFTFLFLILLSYLISNALKINFSIEFFLLSFLSTFLLISIYLILLFSRIVERFGFVRKISVKNLKEGDVLLQNKIWIGITKKEIQKLKKSGKKFVYVKEGVRFGLAFFLSLIFSCIFPTWFLGFFL